MIENAPRLSVVIPTYNRQASLHKVLQGLAGQDLDEPFEVLVISDGSTDTTDEYLRSDEVPLPIVAMRQENAGPAVARNLGVSSATGELVLFVDDDFVPSSSLLRTHLGRHDEMGANVVVIGPMLDPDDFEMSPWVQWEQAMLRKQYAAMRDGLWAASARQFYTANASLRREHIVKAGFFDPDFRRMEDLELAYRLNDLGLTWAFEPEARGYHYAERSYEAWLRIGYDYGRNDVILGRDQERELVMETIVAGFHRRNALIRGLVRLAVPRPRVHDVINRAVETFARSRVAGVSERITRAVLSCSYNLSYHSGVADELGGFDRFRHVLLEKS